MLNETRERDYPPRRRRTMGDGNQAAG
jgi:hypothetical protein